MRSLINFLFSQEDKRTVKHCKIDEPDPNTDSSAITSEGRTTDTDTPNTSSSSNPIDDKDCSDEEKEGMNIKKGL